MKKTYHYTISRTDRICLVTFCIILLAWELVKLILPSVEKSFDYISKPRETYKHTTEYASYEKKNYKKKYSSYPKYQWTKKEYEPKNRPPLPPPSSPISIMNASYDELRSTGLSSKVASNIVKFISSGGIISDTARLMKIYGMDSVQLLNALPYLVFAKKEMLYNPSTFTNSNFPKKESQIVDLNTATIQDLEALSGIGLTLAERIIKFRESLGGFSSPDQLKDCYGIDPELYEKLKPQLTTSGSPRLIHINEVDLTTFAHPYINKRLIRMIKAFKDHHGPFTDASEFRKVYPPDTGWCTKILPYISFEMER